MEEDRATKKQKIEHDAEDPEVIEKSYLKKTLKHETEIRRDLSYRYLYIKYRFQYANSDSDSADFLKKLEAITPRSVLNYFAQENEPAYQFLKASLLNDITTVQAYLNQTNPPLKSKLLGIGLLISAVKGNTTTFTLFLNKYLANIPTKKYYRIIIEVIHFATIHDRKKIIKAITSATMILPTELMSILNYHALAMSIRHGRKKIAKILIASSPETILLKRKLPEGELNLLELATLNEQHDIVQMMQKMVNSNEQPSQAHVKSLKAYAMECLYNHQVDITDFDVPQEIKEEFIHYRMLWQQNALAREKLFSALERKCLNAILTNGSVDRKQGSLFFKYLYTKCAYFTKAYNQFQYQAFVRALEKLVPECVVGFPLDEAQDILTAVFNHETQCTQAIEHLYSRLSDNLLHNKDFTTILLMIAASKNNAHLLLYFLKQLDQSGGHTESSQKNWAKIIKKVLWVIIDYNALFVFYPIISFTDKNEISDVIKAKAIIKCIELNNIGIAKYLLKQLSAQEINEILGIDILEIAAQAGNLELVKMLIETNANHSPDLLMQHAITSGNLQLVQFVAEKFSVDIDQALPHAANSGSLPIVRFLIEKGAKENALNAGCWYALALAHDVKEKPNEDLAGYGLSLGFDRGVINRALLIRAAYQGNIEQLEYLINKEQINDEMILTLALKESFSANQGPVIEYLIKRGVRCQEKEIKTIEDLDQSFLAFLFRYPTEIKYFKALFLLEGYSIQVLQNLVRRCRYIKTENLINVLNSMDEISSTCLDQLVANSIYEGDDQFIRYLLNNKLGNTQWCFDNARLTQAIEQAEEFNRPKLKKYLIEYQQSRKIS